MDCDYQRMTAPCGLDCFNCPLYLASRDEGLQVKLAEKLGVSVEKASCPGCREVEGTIAFLEMTEPCRVYQCTQQRGHSLCSECSDFPCDNLHPFADRASEVPHNTKVFNLGLIKKMGLEEWAREKAGDVRKTYFRGKFQI